MQAYIAKINHFNDSLRHRKLSSIIYFAGCDFKCPNCNTPDILETKEEFLIDLKEVKREIKENASAVKTVVFTGGEPCLQRQALLSLASYAKDARLRTKIVTNGSKTECLRSLINLNLIDNIVLDIKAPFEEKAFQRATRSRTFFKTSMELINDIKSTIRLLKQSQDKVGITIRTLITPSLISRKEDLFKIAEFIEDLDCIWELKKFSSDNVTDKKYSDINPPSELFLHTLKEAIQKRYPNIRIMLE